MKKTQFGWVPTVIFLLMIPIVYATSPYIEGLFYLIPTLIVLWLLFYNLTIEITDEAVKWSFGIGLIKGSYALSEISSVRKQTYFPLGYGLRFRPGVRLYNVSGTKAIALTFKNKSGEIWLGTAEPEALVQFIESKLKHN